MRDGRGNGVLWRMGGGMLFYEGWKGECCFMRDGRRNVVL